MNNNQTTKPETTAASFQKIGQISFWISYTESNMDKEPTVQRFDSCKKRITVAIDKG